MAGEPGRIDVWWFRFDGAAEAAAAASRLLEPEERSRFRRFSSPAAAEFFAFRRAARRVVLASYLDKRPERIRFEETGRGKPRLIHPATDLDFGTSDTGATGVIAVAVGTPVGVDVESMRRDVSPRLAERILSPEELQDWRRLGRAERSRLALRAWTAKEALVKAMGIGLDLAAFRQITLAADAGCGAWQEASLGAGLAANGPWHVRWLELAEVPEALLASVAAPAPCRVRVIDARNLLLRHGL